MTTTATGSAIPVIRSTGLRPHQFPAPPMLLPCGLCDVPWGEHGVAALAGHDFTRPRLPAGYGYVDELTAGARFAFLTGRVAGPGRVAQRVERCVADHLVRVDSYASGFPLSSRWVRDSTIVGLLDARRYA